MCSIVIILGVAMCAALLCSSSRLSSLPDWPLHRDLFGIDLRGFVFLAILAFFIHVISPNKYVGYFGYIAFLILTTFVWSAAACRHGSCPVRDPARQ